MYITPHIINAIGKSLASEGKEPKEPNNGIFIFLGLFLITLILFALIVIAPSNDDTIVSTQYINNGCLYMLKSGKSFTDTNCRYNNGDVIESSMWNSKRKK